MERLVSLSFTCCCVLVLLEKAVAPPPPFIEAYKPTVGLTTSAQPQDRNSGFGSLNKLRQMLKNLEDEIDDMNVRRKIMEAQMKDPFSILPKRMEAAVEYTDYNNPSRIYRNKKIMSATGVFLQIFEDGTANGTKDGKSPYANLTIEMVGINGIMLIKGEKSKKYLACKGNGKFMAVSKRSRVAMFESEEPPEPKNKPRQLQTWHLKVYRNLKCVTYNWWLGFRHNNKLKKGRHSRRNQYDSWFRFP